jgi:Protein of unknown function (DUF2442)
LYLWQVRAAFAAESFPKYKRLFGKTETYLRRDGMSTLPISVEPLAVDVNCTEDALQIVLADGREVAVPLVWFPRLQNATPEQRERWRLIGGGVGIHWEDVDEDISVESLLAIR